MDRQSRFRVALVGVFTLGVMGAVVVAAINAKAHGSGAGSLGALEAARKRALSEPAPAPLPPECLPSAEAPARLRFELPADRLDLGAVKQGNTIERDVVVRNTGSGILCVPDKPHTGCGCVQAEWVGETRIPPTGTGIVRLRIDTKGKEGHIDKDVTLASNDPDRRQAVFKVAFDVKLGVLVARSPNVTAGSVLFFGRHAPGMPATAVVRLKTPRDDPEWKVTDVLGTKTKLVWSVAPAEPNDPVFRQFDVTITHPGSQQLDLNDESVKILTTHPDRPEILLQSQLLVAKKYYTSPPTVRFGFVGGATSAVATPRVVTVFPGEEGTTFTVREALVEGRGFTAGAPIDHGKDGWQVEIRYDEQKRGKGPVDAKLVLHLSDPELPVVEVPLHAEVRD